MRCPTHGDSNLVCIDMDRDLWYCRSCPTEDLSASGAPIYPSSMYSFTALTNGPGACTTCPTCHGRGVIASVPFIRET
jgi:hypothetical protein